MRRVVVLRPEPGACETLERARAAGLKAVAIPLFKIEPVAWEVPEAASFDALLLTSANAVRCGGDGLKALRGLPVHAVGKATADAARDSGFDIASTGEAGVERLLGSIEPGLRLLHLCGEQRAEVEAPQRITAVTVYRAKAIEKANVAAAAGGVVLVHSPRAGQRFAELADGARLDRSGIAIAAISEAARDAAGPGWGAAEAADTPEDAALLALAARLCNKPGPK